jgi:type II secretory pathway component GspD/PulD (secretin)
MKWQVKNKNCLIVVLIITLAILTVPNLVIAEPDNPEAQPLITATFFDSDLMESIKEVALQSKVNILVDENVKGVITLDIKNVPLEKALQMMLIGGGYCYRKIDDFYVVGLPDPKNPAFTGLSESVVYYLKNINADSAKSLLPSVYEPYVKFDNSKDSVCIIAPPELLKKIFADIQKMDGERKQIKIKALVTEISNEVLKEWGMNVFDIDFNASGVGTRTLALDLAGGTLSGKGDAGFGHFSATIKALADEKKATIHADPELLVTEGKSGDLFVGEKRTLILYSTGTNSSSSSTENVEAGVGLKVTPKIVGDQIELTISQNISNFTDKTTEDKIVVKSRTYSSTVRFLPGQTVMVAGLTDKNDSNETIKTPILGDIPIVGYLFKQKSKAKANSQLLVFLTAEVVKE